MSVDAPVDHPAGTGVLAARWRPLVVLACVAVGIWVAWFTRGDVEWLTSAVFLPVPAIIAVAVAPTWRVGVPAVAGLLVAAPALVLLSTQRSGVLQPPSTDWLAPYLVLAVIAWGAGFAARVRRAGPDARGTLLMIGGGVAVVLLCLGVVVIGGGGNVLPARDDPQRDGIQWVRGDDLPDGAGLRRAGAWECTDEEGAAMDCPQATEFWATDGRPAAEVAAQLAAELRALGWPVTEQVSDFYVGCLPMRGVFTWDERICVEIAVAGEASLQPDKPNSATSVMLILS